MIASEFCAPTLGFIEKSGMTNLIVFEYQGKKRNTQRKPRQADAGFDFVGFSERAL